MGLGLGTKAMPRSRACTDAYQVNPAHWVDQQCLMRIKHVFVSFVWSNLEGT